MITTLLSKKKEQFLSFFHGKSSIINIFDKIQSTKVRYMGTTSSTKKSFRIFYRRFLQF